MLPGLSVVEPLLIDNILGDLPQVLKWIKREKPDAIISPGCDLLHGILPRKGWRVPQDIGLAWLSCTHLGHPCSGIYQNGHLIGATAIDTLISQVERHERGLPLQATTLMVEGQWNEGSTLRPALPV
jgi:LacI family transcriptional regulator